MVMPLLKACLVKGRSSLTGSKYTTLFISSLVTILDSYSNARRERFISLSLSINTETTISLKLIFPNGLIS